VHGLGSQRRHESYGINGKLIDFGVETEVETRSLLNKMLGFVSTEVNELGTQKEMAPVEAIMRERTGTEPPTRRLGHVTRI
jgi:carboxylate-amine ligase